MHEGPPKMNSFTMGTKNSTNYPLIQASWGQHYVSSQWNEQFQFQVALTPVLLRLQPNSCGTHRDTRTC